MYNDHLIKEAILHEVYRGGQVFFVHNKVKVWQKYQPFYKSCALLLKLQLHGQMEAEKLEKFYWIFIDHKFDVLVCTNIIETGLDILMSIRF